MPMLSYVHQLFNADQCHAYIHTLRWKDRPLQCPRCQSHNVGPWGAYHYQPGLKRYRCIEKDCKRTFNDLTGTLLDGSKRSVMYWMLATYCERAGGAWPYELSLVLVAAQYSHLLRNRAPGGGHEQRASQTRRDKAPGPHRSNWRHAESWIMPINVWQAPFASVFSRISWKHSSA